MGAKRAATSPAKGAPKRAKAELEGAFAAKVDAVVAALRNEAFASAVPTGVRQMLSLGAPAALQTSKEERHEMQEKVLGRIREALADIVDGLRAKVAEPTAGV